LGISFWLGYAGSPFGNQTLPYTEATAFEHSFPFALIRFDTGVVEALLGAGELSLGGRHTQAAVLKIMHFLDTYGAAC